MFCLPLYNRLSIQWHLIFILNENLHALYKRHELGTVKIIGSMAEQKYCKATGHTSDPWQDWGTHWDSIKLVLFFPFLFLLMPEQIRKNSVSRPYTGRLYLRGLDVFFFSYYHVYSLFESMAVPDISQISPSVKW